jgi:hypothetical protein
MPATGEYFPIPQSVHAAEPIVSLYFPGKHAVHGPPMGPVYPMLQVLTIHAALDVLARGETRPAGHDVHTALPVVSL